MIDKENLSGDIFGGVNAGMVALPAALAFGTSAGLEPIYGLYCAIFLGLIAPIIGGAKTLISNPTGPMAVVTAGVVSQLNDRFFLSVSTNGDEKYYKLADILSAGLTPENFQNNLSQLTEMGLGDRLSVIWPYLFLIIILAASVQILFGILKLGKYISYIPTPVVSGFMSGIGLIIIISQIPKFLGSHFKGKTLDTLLNLPEIISHFDITSVVLASVTMAIIYLFPKITKKVPSPLVAIVVVTTVAYFMGLGKEYLIPEIKADALPNPIDQIHVLTDLPTLFSQPGSEEIIKFIIFSGLTLAILGIIDALLTAVVGDQLTKEKHNSDREMIGQGVGNAVSALFGGMMGAGTTPATVLNIKSGGRTRLSGIIHALVLIIILLVAAPVASAIPKAALAGLLITVGISILDFEVFKQIKKIPIQDNVIMIVVLILTAFWDLVPAVAVGLVMAALIFMKKMADVVEGMSNNSKFDRLVNQLIDTFSNSEIFREKVYVKNLRGPMFFGFASRFQDQMDEIPDDKKAVVLNFGGVTYMDQSGMYTLKESVQRLVDKKINVVLSELSENSYSLLEGIDVIPEMVDDKHVFSSVEGAVMWLNEPGHLEDNFADDNELYIPSAYTPNGDGINDEWQLRNIDQYPNCIVTIKNREGLEIFRSIGYEEMWEGIYQGKNLPSDQYHYKIDLYGNEEKVLEGKVSIFR